MRASDILTITPEGLFCPPGDFHIDPVRPVPRALITHGHSDHARPGHQAVLATRETLAIMGVRMGAGFARTREAMRFGETRRIGDVNVTFRPAGHVLGSAQISMEAAGIRIVASGDYKRQPDPTCAAFEPTPCDIFISEATFGLPVFRHPPAHTEIERLLASRALFPERAHLVGVYALGKAQRVAALLREAGYDRPLYLHGALLNLTRLYAEHGVALGEFRQVEPRAPALLAGEIILCPPTALNDGWARKFPDPARALASGWMRIRARAKQVGIELPLIISDHADWDELCGTIRDTGCGEVWVTHGQEDALVHWAQTQGLRARPLSMIGYGDGDEEHHEAVRERSS